MLQTATTATPLSTSRKRVFDSVFSPISVVPRPDSIPVTQQQQQRAIPGSSGPSRSSRAKAKVSNVSESDPEPEKLARQQAWHAAMTFLAVPDRGYEMLMAYEDSSEEEEGFLKHWNRHHQPSKDVVNALGYVIREPSSTGIVVESSTSESRGLLEWYESEVRRHFLKNFRKGLVQLVNDTKRDDALKKVVHYLQLVRNIYLTPVIRHVLPLMDAVVRDRAFMKLQQGFHAIVSYALPWSRVSTLLTREIAEEAYVILGIDTLNRVTMCGVSHADGMDVDREYSISYNEWMKEPSEQVRARVLTESEDSVVNAARARLLSLMNGLQLVGLGGDKAQQVFANVMNALLTEFIRMAYGGQWEGPSRVIEHLRLWTMNLFARLVVQVLAVINAPESNGKRTGDLDVSFADVTRWQETGVNRLGALRTAELFDIIVEWPASVGAIEDLKHFLTQPASRSFVTISFISTLNQRFLHPGASTVEILQLYISTIRAFNLLDPKGVLLDRIARPIRRYLRDRDDTIKVIVRGLLADADEANGHPSTTIGDALVELSFELTKAHQTSRRNEVGELDWDDMNWMPDPVDAAPDYRKSKTSDVIGSLISLFDSKETFVKELQNTLAERLLRKRADFEQEMSVLELLKLRFGDSALQACEVMMRDVFDSRRVDTVVRRDQGLDRNQRHPPVPVTPDRSVQVVSGKLPDLHAKILSRFFWPDIQGQEFKVPDPISFVQQRYAAGFESLKQSRKLTWLNGLGQVTVELDLEDRVFVDEVTTWQATVIYAFQSQSTDPGNLVSKTVPDLAQQLDMSAALVRSACLFWVSKRILIETSRDTFRVLEVLPDEGENGLEVTSPGMAGRGRNAGDRTADAACAASAAAAAAAAAATAAKETAEAAAMEKMNLYWQFIVGMLTNQGAMPLQRIVMMLKIAVPGGFPFSNEELREFLAGMVDKGKLEIVSGGNYKIVS